VAKRRRKSSGDSVKVDFSKVKDGGRTRLPEGNYRLKVLSVKQDEAQSGNPMLVWTFAIVGGKHDGKKIVDRTMLLPKSLWVLRNLMEAMGLKVPKKMVELPLKKFKGKELGAAIVDGEEYNNRVSSEVGDYITLDALEEEDEEEDDDFEDDEDDEDEDDLDEEEDDLDEDEDDDDEDEDEDDDEEDLEELELDDL